MKGKLIKRTNERYDLYYSEDINQLNTIASTQYELNIGKLSIQNCQVIENGYDLDELAIERYGNDPNLFGGQRDGFKEGFQKALELLCDKNFSEKDVHHALHLMNNQGRLAYIDNALEMVKKSTEQRDNIIQSLQQTEWDVEIEMETCSMNPLDLDCSEIVERPKINANGCLTLKRI